MASLAGDLLQPQSLAPVGRSDPEKNCGAVARNIIRVIRKSGTREEEGVFNGKVKVKGDLTFTLQQFCSM